MPKIDFTYTAGALSEEAAREHEITEGSWGAAGQIVRFEQLREAARAQREGAGSAA